MIKHTFVGQGASFEEAVERANAQTEALLKTDPLIHAVTEVPFVTCVDGQHVTYCFFVTLLVDERRPSPPVKERPSRFLGG